MSGTNQILIDDEDNPLTENTRCSESLLQLQFYSLGRCPPSNRWLNTTSTTFRKPYLLPSSGKMYLISSISVAPTDWQGIHLRGPIDWVQLVWKWKQIRLPKNSVLIFTYLLHDGQCPREEDCGYVLYIIVIIYKLIFTSKVICLEKNTEKTRYMFIFPEQSAG